MVCWSCCNCDFNSLGYLVIFYLWWITLGVSSIFLGSILEEGAGAFSIIVDILVANLVRGFHGVSFATSSWENWSLFPLSFLLGLLLGASSIIWTSSSRNPWSWGGFSSYSSLGFCFYFPFFASFVLCVSFSFIIPFPFTIFFSFNTYFICLTNPKW